MSGSSRREISKSAIIAAAVLGVGVAAAAGAWQLAGADRTGWRHFDLYAVLTLDFSMFRMKKGDDESIAFSRKDRDLVIRTVYGESAYEPRLGQMAVAWVMRNRLLDNKYGWDSLAEVVTHCGYARRDKRRIRICQFEPWLNRQQELMALAEDSDDYRRIGSVVDDVLEGRTEDPTAGAWYFLNKRTVQKRRAKEGREMPKWAQNCMDIGRHSFCKPTPEQLAEADSTGGIFSGLKGLVRWWW
jgi:spore germination cell wall hydrolase CwlJ-like protein